MGPNRRAQERERAAAERAAEAKRAEAERKAIAEAREDRRYLECPSGRWPGSVVLPDDRSRDCGRASRGCRSHAPRAVSSDRWTCARWTGTRPRRFQA